MRVVVARLLRSAATILGGLLRARAEGRHGLLFPAIPTLSRDRLRPLEEAHALVPGDLVGFLGHRVPSSSRGSIRWLLRFVATHTSALSLGVVPHHTPFF
jgi:hypothetical protein